MTTPTPIAAGRPSAIGAPSDARMVAPSVQLVISLGLDALLLATGLGLAIGLRAMVGHWLGVLRWAPGAAAGYFACVLIALASLAYEGIYNRGLMMLDQTDRLVKALTGGLAVTTIFSFATQRSDQVSRFVLIAAYLIGLLLFAFLRPLLRRCLPVAAALRVAAADERAAALLVSLRRAGVRLNTASDVPGAAGAGAAMLVYLGAGFAEAQVADWEARYGSLGLIPTDCDLTTLGAEPVNLHGVQMFSIIHPLSYRVNRAVKRGFDVAGAAVLLVAAVPAFVAAALAVRWESAGPVFFRQERLGRGGRRFRAWKFRTMFADAQERLDAILGTDPARADEYRRTFKLRDDPRVTKVGRFLRRTSLDELPQLWNVLRGDMSLVGPRPIVEGERSRYGAAYAVVATVRPGLTGIWQTSGRSLSGYEVRKFFDVFYVRRWSLWLDIATLIRTLRAMVLTADF